jgi:hypothetical protein
MRRQIVLFSIYIILIPNISGAIIPEYQTFNSGVADHDSVPGKQLLFNGRIWISLYSNVSGNEFLITRDWLNGEVEINDITFKNVPLRYDICNDELLSIVNQGTVIRLNKELVKGFMLPVENKKMVFENFGTGPGNPVKGYGQVLYRGNICLIEKQKKLIKELAIQNKYDEFYQEQSLYILKNGIFYKITGRRDMLKVLSDKEAQLKGFLHDKKIRVRKRVPESFLPAIIFYDNLIK